MMFHRPVYKCAATARSSNDNLLLPSLLFIISYFYIYTLPLHVFGSIFIPIRIHILYLFNYDEGFVAIICRTSLSRLEALEVFEITPFALVIFGSCAAYASANDAENSRSEDIQYYLA